MDLCYPHVGFSPVWPGTLGKHMTTGRPVDEVGGEDDGEGIWFVAGGYCGQVAQAGEAEHCWVSSVRVNHCKQRVRSHMIRAANDPSVVTFTEKAPTNY